ncbi:hypothetical protein [Saprospira grandis]|uniref:hypothetical protein n=1 Tax=Saprospira grandis TaxID=1008 RepID=UPI0022DE5515|nr:hypothetical protein [Saprospira grandis]WBM74824.1 hypothetical protein OP864_01020 [Saprospira grandis]
MKQGEKVLMWVDTSGSMLDCFDKVDAIIAEIRKHRDLVVKTKNGDNIIEISKLKGFNKRKNYRGDIDLAMIPDSDYSEYSHVILITDIENKYSSEEIFNIKGDSFDESKVYSYLNMENKRIYSRKLVIYLVSLVFLVTLYFVFFSNNKNSIKVDKGDYLIKDSLKTLDDLKDSIDIELQSKLKRAQDEWNSSKNGEIITLNYDSKVIIDSIGRPSLRIKATLDYQKEEYDEYIVNYPSGVFTVPEKMVVVINRVRKDIDSEFSKYKEIDLFEVTLIGSADAVPFSKRYLYNKADIDAVKFYDTTKDLVKSMELKKGDFYTGNDTLAFLRLRDIEETLIADPKFKIAQIYRRIETRDTTNEVGEFYRRVQIQFNIEGNRTPRG